MIQWSNLRLGWSMGIFLEIPTRSHTNLEVRFDWSGDTAWYKTIMNQWKFCSATAPSLLGEVSLSGPLRLAGSLYTHTYIYIVIYNDMYMCTYKHVGAEINNCKRWKGNILYPCKAFSLYIYIWNTHPYE